MRVGVVCVRADTSFVRSLVIRSRLDPRTLFATPLRGCPVPFRTTLHGSNTLVPSSVTRCRAASHLATTNARTNDETNQPTNHHLLGSPSFLQASVPSLPRCSFLSRVGGRRSRCQSVASRAGTESGRWLPCLAFQSVTRLPPGAAGSRGRRRCGSRHPRPHARAKIDFLVGKNAGGEKGGLPQKGGALPLHGTRHRWRLRRRLRRCGGGWGWFAHRVVSCRVGR
mmetsp:Transcript_25599/g.53351  ORF Transcript_25599/g.53351 Transcript_25599/m.53351 type:complete len:225 (-) Transcript_25599:149-823(-)